MDTTQQKLRSYVLFLRLKRNELVGGESEETKELFDRYVALYEELVLLDDQILACYEKLADFDILPPLPEDVD